MQLSRDPFMMKAAPRIKRFALFALAFTIAMTAGSLAWGSGVRVKFINKSKHTVAVVVLMEYMNGSLAPASQNWRCVLPGGEFTTDTLTTTAVAVQAIPFEKRCEGRFLADITIPRQPADRFGVWNPATAELTESEGHFKLAWRP